MSSENAIPPIMRGEDHQFGYMPSTGYVNCICGWRAPCTGTREEAREAWEAHTNPIMRASSFCEDSTDGLYIAMLECGRFAGHDGPHYDFTHDKSWERFGPQGTTVRLVVSEFNGERT